MTKNIALHAAMTASAVAMLLASVNLFASDFLHREAAPVVQKEVFKDFVPTVGWLQCYRLSFPCLRSESDICKHLLFGKTNSKEINFGYGLHQEGSLLCVFADFDHELQMMHIVLASTDDNDPWPDSIVDALQPEKGIDEFTSMLECQITHTEWDEFWCWPTDADTRKTDFLDWISTHRW